MAQADVWSGRISLRRVWKTSRNGSVCYACGASISIGEKYFFYDYWPKYNPKLFTHRSADLCKSCTHSPGAVAAIVNIGYQEEKEALEQNG
jgi:hypothetical protein